MRTPLFAGNWKMFKTVHEAVAFAKEFKGVVKDVDGVDIVWRPPFTAVHAVARRARIQHRRGRQDVYWEREGRSPARCRPQWSARPVRSTSSSVTRSGGGCSARPTWREPQADAATCADLTPIVCVGETLEEREASQRSRCSIGS
jgi:triosephosphate isomerase